MREGKRVAQGPLFLTTASSHLGRGCSLSSIPRAAAPAGHPSSGLRESSAHMPRPGMLPLESLEPADSPSLGS